MPQNKVARPQPEPVPAPEPGPVAEVVPEPRPVVGLEPETVVEPVSRRCKPISLDIRTNLLYDALLTPTIGLEWRINRHVGIKVDCSWSHWGSEPGRVQKMWLVSPKVRWYLLDAKRFYVGLGANFGQANIYKGVVSVLFKDTGYRGDIYGGGVTVDYRLPRGRSLAFNFNLGLGCTHFKYDTFTVRNYVRVFRERHQSKNFWGPAQARVTLIWRIGGNQ